MQNDRFLEDRASAIVSLKKVLSLESVGVHFLCTGSHIPTDAIVEPFQRLNIVLSGEKHISMPLITGQSTLTLQAGEAYLCPPNSWELYRWDSCHELLCIVLRPDYLRLSTYSVHEKHDRFQVDNVFFHSQSPPPKALKSAMDALEASRDERFSTAIPSLVQAIATLSQSTCTMPFKPVSTGEALYSRLVMWIENNYRQPLSRKDACSFLQRSEGTISHICRSIGQTSFKEILLNVRIESAMSLLKNTNLNVNQIGYQCGYGNSVHFIRSFRQRTGKTPKQYRLELPQ